MSSPVERDNNDNRNCDEASNTYVEEDEDPGIADAMLQRGEYLRQLRLLAQADEAERHADVQEEPHENDLEPQDQTDELPDSHKTVLRYESYLSHQRYYDDLKHVDINFIDYGIVTGSEPQTGGRLIVEQEKALGKGGLCWDAAFILAEHLIQTEPEWNVCKNVTRVVELGSGTGVCGLLLAKAVSNCHVCITDLPQLEELMRRNLNLNFSATQHEKEGLTLADLVALYNSNDLPSDDNRKPSAGTASAAVLRWGEPKDYRDGPFNIIVGADVVASLYDPRALAETIHALSDDRTIVYLSYKGRLSGPHDIFENAMESLFGIVERVKPSSRNKNPGVWILKATNKI
uniref:Uncharacterized protein n=1 Tax=Attheya septentrionalis TaxID=420275 RepID=A0A7S2UM18_9STRA|mmetsp:Transcript_28039/g.51075  ORF Transcript_28039/g.51075 Transcript_28039/m.51075 type:complete len:346 (+) Transcript_28039:148-1185(+)